MEKNIKPFNVINFEFNTDKFEAYDVMPYFVRCYLSKTENPLTMDGNVEDMNDITYYIGKENFGCVNVFSSKMEDEIKNVKAKLK